MSTILRILMAASLFQAISAARFNRLAKHNTTSACPAKVRLNTKGDCVEDVATLVPVKSECCDKLRECQTDLEVMLGYQSDRLNQYLTTCALSPQDFRVGASGHMELIDPKKVCNDGCTGMVAIDYKETLERCKEDFFDQAQRLESTGAVADSIEKAHKNCGAEPSPAPTPAPTPLPTPAPPREYWSGTCSACPSSFHPGLHCKGPAKQIGERACGVKVFGVKLGCEAKCREPAQTEFWNGRCTFCPAAWYSHCPKGSKLIGERGCGVANAFCEGKCRVDA